LRVDVDGAVAIDGLSFRTTGDAVLVLGAARALFEAAAGLRDVRGGDLFVEGATPRSAVRQGHAACAPLDPPLPPRWTVLSYVTWSARLAGHPRSECEPLAAAALDALQLGSNASTKLGAAGLSLRRATVLAAALATGAPTILIDDPLLALPDDMARPLSRVFARALAERQFAVFAARIPLESPLALAADEAVVIDGAALVAQGAPAELAAAERTVALRVDGDVDAFAMGVERLGARASVAPGAPKPVRVRVELGPLAARDLFRVAAEVSAVVLELRPLSRAFA